MMQNIKTFNKDTLPKTDEMTVLMTHVLNRVKASAYKAVLHRSNPQQYPIDASKLSMERAILNAITNLPGVQATRLSVGEEPIAPAALGYPFRYDTRTPVDDQVSLQPPGVGSHWWDRILIPGPGDQDPQPSPPAPQSSLELRVHTIKCLKETKEWGKDEIDLTGQASCIEKAGTEAAKSVFDKSLEPFRVASFNTGKQVNLNRRIVFAYPLSIGQYPRAYLASLIIVEKDHGSAKKIQEVLDKIKKTFEDDLIESFKGKFALEYLVKLIAVIGPPLLTKAVEWIAAWLGDDLFDPVAVSISIPEAGALLPGGVLTSNVERVVCIRNSAKYEVAYDWNLVQ